eukprot:511311-Prorocentrum_lima.AAC.1
MKGGMIHLAAGSGGRLPRGGTWSASACISAVVRHRVVVLQLHQMVGQLLKQFIPGHAPDHVRVPASACTRRGMRVASRRRIPCCPHLKQVAMCWEGGSGCQRSQQLMQD